MRISKIGPLLIVLGLGLAPLGGCGTEDKSGVQVGGAVEDPEIEAINNASSEIPVGKNK